MCTKVTHKSSIDGKPRILLGVILDDKDAYFLKFKTGRKVYHISKTSIISIETTNQPFIQNGGDSQ